MTKFGVRKIPFDPPRNHQNNPYVQMEKTWKRRALGEVTNFFVEAGDENSSTKRKGDDAGGEDDIFSTYPASPPITSCDDFDE